MSDREVCGVCLRPRYTAEDLARWEAEFGINSMAPEPVWARALCWTKPGERLCKPGLATNSTSSDRNGSVTP